MAQHQRLLKPLLVVLFVFSHLSSIAISTHKITNHVTSYPPFQHLNVHRAIAATKLHPSRVSTKSKLDQLKNNNELITISHDHNKLNSTLSSSSSPNLKLKLKIIHRDKLHTTTTSTSTRLDHHHRFAHRIQRDLKRVAFLVRHLSSNTTTTTTTLDNYNYYNSNKITSFGSNVVSGMEEGSGEYFVRIGVGSPARSQYMVIDSGSDMIWVQCEPCNQCYRQSDPVFNPSQSDSYSSVSCSSSVCSTVMSTSSETTSCRSKSDSCHYQVQYSDGSYTKGTVAFETLTVGSTTVRNVAIGCGHTNKGMFVGAAGLLGLGGGSMSFVGQLGGQAGGAFSYCLVSRGGAGSGSGSLQFGQQALPEGAAWISLLRSPHAPSFYYVGLTGLGVGGARVPIPDGVFSLQDENNGGVVMDTGTAVTRFPTAAYVAFRDAFIAQTGSLPRAAGVSIFDTCYNLGGFSSVRVPTVSFYFAEGPVLTLPARNFMIAVDETGTFCFAFAPSPSGLSIIGNIQQEGIQISIDGANGFLGFGPNVC